MPKGIYVRGEAPRDRYERCVDRNAGADNCHPWTAYIQRCGYGTFFANGRDWLAHRWGYLNLVGPIPDETPHVLHRCDNPPCQNPRHWFLGTHRDNMADMMSKGRLRPGRGERHASAKLTEDDVRLCRSLYAEGTTQRQLAVRFRITDQAMSAVLRRRAWAHVD